jgi:glycolate oxidase iron-sulfur subunit
MSETRFLDYEKSLACIHCGLCLSSCPTYLETGNENDSPRGRIYIMRAVQDGRLPLEADAVRHIDLCLGCRACEAVCPSGVHYGELIESTRDHVEKRYRRSLAERFLRRVAIEKILPYPRRMRAALWPALIVRKLGLEKLLPKFLREAMTLVPDGIWEKSNVKGTASPLTPALSPLRGEGEPKASVGFVSGCVMSVLFGETNDASVRLLNEAGYDVLTPQEQVCCGALFAHSGQLEKARECARRNIEAFEKCPIDAIVINAAGCGSTLKEYGHLLAEDVAWAERARAFSTKVVDLTEFLVRARTPSSPLPCPPKEEREKSSAPPEGTVTYHDACHLAHAQRVTKPPRELVKQIAGKNFIEMPESDVCCGSAGTYNLTEPEMAERLQRRKVENILKSGAKIVITTNPGCILQIRAGLKRAGAKDVQVLHLADYLCR